VLATLFCAWLFAASVRLRAYCSLCLLLDGITLAILRQCLVLFRGGAAGPAREALLSLRASLPREAIVTLLLWAGTVGLLAHGYAGAERRAAADAIEAFVAEYPKLPVELVALGEDSPALGPAGAPVTI